MPPKHAHSTVARSNVVDVATLPKLYRDAVENAVRVSQRAYAPYSNFHVGCCLVQRVQPSTSGSPKKQQSSSSSNKASQNDGPLANLNVSANDNDNDESHFRHAIGCNWENAIYQSTCAERCAIVASNAFGYRTAVACAVYGRSSHAGVSPPPKSIVTPCGLCRQMLNEVAQLSRIDIDILCITNDTLSVRILKLSDMLPLSFGPGDVGVNILEHSMCREDDGQIASQQLLQQPNVVVSPKKGTPKKSQRSGSNNNASKEEKDEATSKKRRT